MKRQRLQGRSRPGRVVTLALLVVVLVSSLVLLPTAGLSQGTGKPHAVVPATAPVNPEGPSASQAISKQLAPDAIPISYPIPIPYLRFAAVLCSGLVISAARLARKFRLLLGLGVFANPYAPLFMVCWASICGIFATSEGVLVKTPVGLFAPWLADLAGPVLTLFLATIGLKSQARPTGQSPVDYIDRGSSSNPILGWLENSIGDRIQKRIQAWVVPACNQYNWATIQQGARYALANERAVGRVSSKEFDAVRRSIESLPVDADSHSDPDNKAAALKYKALKYTALTDLLSWCQFNQLRCSLERAAGEMQS
jgi:hypothetical protein